MGVTFEACKGSGQFRPSGKPKNVAEASSLRTAAGSRCHFVPPHGEKVTPPFTFVRNDKGCIPEKRYSPRWWRHPKDENVSLRAKRSNVFDRDCFVACAPRNDTPSSLMRCHCCSFDRLPLFWNAPMTNDAVISTEGRRNLRQESLSYPE